MYDGLTRRATCSRTGQPDVHRRFIIQNKGTRAHTHRELIQKWLWEPNKGSSLELRFIIQRGRLRIQRGHERPHTRHRELIRKWLWEPLRGAPWNISRCLGVGLYKIFVCIFRDCALVDSIIGTKHLLYFAPLYFAHTLYRAMYGSPSTPVLCARHHTTLVMAISCKGKLGGGVDAATLVAALGAGPPPPECRWGPAAPTVGGQRHAVCLSLMIAVWMALASKATAALENTSKQLTVTSGGRCRFITSTPENANAWVN